MAKPALRRDRPAGERKTRRRGDGPNAATPHAANRRKNNNYIQFRTTSRARRAGFRPQGRRRSGPGKEGPHLGFLLETAASGIPGAPSAAHAAERSFLRVGPDGLRERSNPCAGRESSRSSAGTRGAFDE